jgi:hypothetical protein
LNFTLVGMNLRDGPTGNDIALGLHQLYDLGFFVMTGNHEMVSDWVRAEVEGVLVRPIYQTEFQRSFDGLLPV